MVRTQISAANRWDENPVSYWYWINSDGSHCTGARWSCLLEKPSSNLAQQPFQAGDPVLVLLPVLCHELLQNRLGILLTAGTQRICKPQQLVLDLIGDLAILQFLVQDTKAGIHKGLSIWPSSSSRVKRRPQSA